jgi:hypothetical protein
MEENMVNMNMKILDVIHAVLDYRAYITSDNIVTNIIDMSKFDKDKLTFEYYCSLPLPDGMNKNHSDFQRILNYKNWERLTELDNTEEKDLCRYVWKIE